MPTGDMDYTMTHKMSRRACLDVALDEDDELQPLKKILSPGTTSKLPDNTASPEDEARYVANCHTHLSNLEYMELLRYMNNSGRPCQSIYNAHPSPVIPFLPQSVQELFTIHLDDRIYRPHKKHEPNSAIQFTDPSMNQRDTGNIDCIWEFSINYEHHTVVVVRPHRALSADELRMTPFPQFNSEYATCIVNAEPSQTVVYIEPQHIITHLSTIQRPSGTYGIKKNTGC